MQIFYLFIYSFICSYSLAYQDTFLTVYIIIYVCPFIFIGNFLNSFAAGSVDVQVGRGHFVSTHKLGRRQWVLALYMYEVLSNSIHQLHIGKVEKLSANHRPGWPPLFSNRPEKHKPGKGRWVLVFWQFSSNAVISGHRREVCGGRTTGKKTCRLQEKRNAYIDFFFAHMFLLLFIDSLVSSFTFFR